MQHWLLKSDPDTWSWDDQVAAKSTEWDGVRNHQASNFMKEMAVGDKAFFYHSGSDRAIVGIVAVAKKHHPDSTDDTGRFGCVDVKTVGPVKEPVTLKQIKAEPKLKDIMLVKNSRLSVMPITDDEWKAICRMAGVKP